MSSRNVLGAIEGATLGVSYYDIGNHGYGGTGHWYYIEFTEGESKHLVQITDEQAEELMLKMGIGERVFDIDTERGLIVPRIRNFLESYRGHPTEDEARAALEAYYDSQVKTLIGKRKYIALKGI